MSKKKVYCAKLSIPIYSQEITFYISKSIINCAKALKKDHPDYNIEGIETCKGCVIKILDQGCTHFNILLEVVDGEDIIPLLAHECVHAAWRILDCVGVKLKANNHESLAYLVEYILEAGCTILKEYTRELKN